MLEALGLMESMQFFIFLMLSFAFFTGILLLVSQEAFNLFSEELQKEYGLKKRFFPKVEEFRYEVVDFILLKYRFVAGILITVVSFILLLIYK